MKESDYIFYRDIDNTGKIYYTAQNKYVKEIIGGGDTLREAYEDAELNLNFYIEYKNRNKNDN